MGRTREGLTPAQEAFCLAVVETNNQAEAYRRAYPKSLKWKDNAVWVNASALMADTKVSLRVAELRSIIAERAQITLEEGAKTYRKLIAYGMEPSEDDEGLPTKNMRDPAVALKATDSLMKLGGLFKESGPSVSITNQVLVIDVSEKDA